jgi:hypothetical protein
MKKMAIEDKDIIGNFWENSVKKSETFLMRKREMIFFTEKKKDFILLLHKERD